MNRWTSIVLVPFLLFVGIIVVWGATALLFVSAGVIANILRAFFGWIIGTLPKLVVATFSDPWKIAALPMAVGVVILVGWWAWDDLTKDSRSQVLRGRELGSSRAQPRIRTVSRSTKLPTPKGGRSRWTRSNRPHR